jgi:hypothetical protein
MAENKNAKTPSDGGSGFIDGVWYGPGPTAWQCQCGKAYTVTCISSKPTKREWVGLTKEEIAQGPQEVLPALYGRWGWAEKEAFEAVVAWAEAKLREKNT